MKVATFALLASTALGCAPAFAGDIAAPIVEAATKGADIATGGDDQRRDIVVTGERTEGDDSYTVGDQSTATRMPLSLRETPQSVSVVTRSQIEDFQLNDINALLATVPGVVVQAQETDRIYYSARGYDIQTFQIDGVGLPFAFGIQTGSIDTAIYDHIEVVRGAPGLLSPTGNPSAVVNFIRKRPTRDLQASASAQYGSYDHLRLDGDVSVPVTKDGSIRARAVGAYLDEDSYLDRYGLKRWIGYGIVEADLGPDTVVSAGYGHQKHKSRGATWGGLPLFYTDGTQIEYDRSANSAPEWSHWGVTDRQIFGDITHHLSSDWLIKVSAVRRAITEEDALFYVYQNPVRGAPGGIDASDPDSIKGIVTYPGAFQAETRNLTLDAYVTGKVSLFGRQHDVTFGVNRAAQHYIQGSAYDFAAIGQPISIEDMLAGTFPYPNFPTEYDYTTTSLSQETHSRRESAYGLARLNLSDPWKLMLGGSVTHAMQEGYAYGPRADYDHTRFLPFIGTTYDLTPNVSFYASYATIFNPQSQIKQGGGILDPIEGDNIEGGLKGEWYEGRLNASVAFFQARQNNTAEALPFDPTIGQTVYRGVDSKSQGIEVELGGELLPGLQATGGFTMMRIIGDEHQDARTFVPRRTANLNLSWTPVGFDRLKLGAAMRYQSKIYLEPEDTVSDTTGEQVRINQGGYALVDLFAGYKLTDQVRLSVNLRNVTNAKYLTALNASQSHYGAPRTVLGTISVGF
ncbi:TonB-dependent siderophore receptor [Stakelama pacifica]|uniref:Outer membrane receptor for ferric coprogen and ferric-rhodotorulic acid n=1 Tax=Stakelama pacifica TaxID=517720 RepID=A0A4R6FHK6_9SPHN|nr:TonB-dependent siderophore receptor [Stakelama pacifica]TDN80280.1 outer membrane receptor for ferric coprogen and ferric-rhodotorulic acid [Stakelama pacifica]